MSDRIPIIFSIDVEPDEQNVDRELKPQWKGYEVTWEFVAGLRSRVAAVTGSPAHFTWFLRMDPQVEEVYGSATWAVEQYRNSLDDLEAQGDELGLHVHALRWDRERNTWLNDHADQAWLDHCVRTAFTAFGQSFGRGCASVSFGGRFLNEATLNLMEALGARFDLTIEPGQPAELTLDPTLPYTGSLPDHSDYPRRPYQPSRIDLSRPASPGERELWEIPMSSGKIEGVLGNFDRALRRALRLPPPERRAYRSFNLKQLGSQRFAALLEQCLAAHAQPYVSVIIRSSALLTDAGARNVRENVEVLLSHPLAKRFAFSTPAEALTLLGYFSLPDVFKAQRST